MSMSHPFTPTYISMSKAAEEIQAMRPPFQNGDAYYREPWPDSVDYVGTSTHFDGRPSNWGHVDDWDDVENPIWLPRLDQLLGILGGPQAFFDAGLTTGHNEYILHAEEFDGSAKDWHELALTVVMREKYGKTWTGTEWGKA